MSIGSASTPSACTPSTTTSGRPFPSAFVSLASGSLTPVPECTHVSASTFVFGVIAACSRSIISSAVACAGSS